jgi:glycosyltransferase involved in cell wall biosynthesis
VASRIGALGELVTHETTGLLVPPGDAAALAGATARALADPAASGWGAAAQAHARTAFAPAAHAHGLVRIYEEAMRA